MTGGSEEVEEKPRSVEEVAAVSIVTDLRMERGGLAISQTATQLLPCILVYTLKRKFSLPCCMEGGP